MRLRAERPYRCREQHGRGSGGSSLLDKAQHRVVLPAGPSPHLAGPDVLHPGVTDRAVVVEQNADDEAFVMLPVSCRRTAAFRWHRGSLRKSLRPVTPAVDTSPKERRGGNAPSLICTLGPGPGWLRQATPGPRTASDSFCWNSR